jgi:hypothetical protein
MTSCEPRGPHPANALPRMSLLLSNGAPLEQRDAFGGTAIPRHRLPLTTDGRRRGRGAVGRRVRPALRRRCDVHAADGYGLVYLPGARGLRASQFVTASRGGARAGTEDRHPSYGRSGVMDPSVYGVVATTLTARPGLALPSPSQSVGE